MKHSPILKSCTWVFAATDTNHDGAEQKEEAGHGEAHAVHRLIAHDDITVNLVFKTRYGTSSLAKSWDLQNSKESEDKCVIKLIKNILTGEIIV